MTRYLAAVLLALVPFAMPASSATISITSDQPTYEVGDTITLTIAGDAEGATAWAAFGNLLYDPSLTNTLSVTQGALGPDWVLGGAPSGDGHAYVWNQIAPEPMTGTSTSTVVLLATAPGTLGFTWDVETLEFFGANAPDFSLSLTGDPLVVEPPPVVESPPVGEAPASVPEPSAALVFAVGLVVAGAARRAP